MGYIEPRGLKQRGFLTVSHPPVNPKPRGSGGRIPPGDYPRRGAKHQDTSRPPKGKK